MTNKQKNRLGNICAILVILISAYLVAFTLGKGSNSLAWVLAFANCIGGPVCLVFYIIEVKRGVFADDKNAEEDLNEEGKEELNE